MSGLRFKGQTDYFGEHRARLSALRHEMRTDEAPATRRPHIERLIGKRTHLVTEFAARQSCVECNCLHRSREIMDTCLQVRARGVDVSSGIVDRLLNPVAQHSQQLVGCGTQRIAHKACGFQSARLRFNPVAYRRRPVRTASRVVAHQRVAAVRRPAGMNAIAYSRSILVKISPI